MRDGMTTVERDRIKALERENRELRQANEILRKASAYFAPPLGDCRAITCRAAGRNSTAHSGDDWLYRGSSRCLRCRVDLQNSTDCTVHILSPTGVSR